MVMLTDQTEQYASLEERGRVEWPFQVRLMLLSDLFVDETYQRPIQERFVQQIADGFDETLVGAIDVSARDDDRHAILDGQQRYWGMGRRGKTTAYAAVFEGMTVEDEAGFFYRKNKDRKAMKGYFGFRARAVAGEPTAVQIDQTVRDEGFRLGEATDHDRVVGAVASVERAWSYSGQGRNECLTPTLRTIRGNFRGRDGSLDSWTILGFARFWQTFSDEEVDGEALAAAIEDIGSPRNLAGLGKEKTVTGISLPYGIAATVAETYNRKKRGGSRAPNFPGRLDPERLWA